MDTCLTRKVEFVNRGSACPKSRMMHSVYLLQGAVQHLEDKSSAAKLYLKPMGRLQYEHEGAAL